MRVHHRFNVGDDQGVTFIRFLERQLVDGIDLATVWRELLLTIEAEGRHKLVLDFSLVTFLSGEALGRLIALHTTVTANKGMLKLCCLCPHVLEVFTVTKLDGLFGIEKTEAAALAALA